MTEEAPKFVGSLQGYCREEFYLKYPGERCVICTRQDGTVTAYNKKHTMRFDKDGKEIS